MNLLRRLAGFGAPGWARSCFLGLAFAASAVAAQSSPASAGKIFLWEVKSATNSAYVFGSIHAARADFYPLPRVVEDAYRQADELAVEVDITNQAEVSKTMPLLIYAPPDSLERHVSPEVWKSLQSALASTVQERQELLGHLKAGALASALVLAELASHGYDPQAGIDRHFLASAHADGKKVIELESAQFQAGILGGLSDEEGDAMLKETLKEAHSGELARITDQVVAAWRAGDTKEVARLLRESNHDAASKRIFARLFDERNPGMADRIAALATGSSHAFVVIGAGHLASEKSVLQLLMDKGLQVRQLP